MKAHEEIDRLADLYAAGGLEDPERREVADHAKGCAPCASALTDAEGFAKWASGAIAADGPPGDLEDRILRRLPEKKAASQQKSFRWVPWVAAAGFFIMVGSIFTQSHTDTVVMQDALEVASETIGDEIPADAGSPVMVGYRGVANGGTKSGLGVQAGSGIDGGVYNQMRIGSSSVIPEEAKVENLPGLVAGSLVPADSSTVTVTAVAAEPVVVRLALSPSPFAAPSDLRVDGVYSERHSSPAYYANLATTGFTADSLAVGTASVGDAEAKSLKTLATAEADFRSNDRDGNKISDYWTASVAGLYTMTNSALSKGANPLSLIELSVHPLQQDQKLIRKGDVNLEVESYEETYVKIAGIVGEEKGFIAGVNSERLANGKMRATVTVRVPLERFEAAIARLRELGTVRNLSVTSQDVTKKYFDLQARRESKSTLIERLKKVMLEGKGTVKDLLEVEVQMGKTLEEIDAIKGELKYFDNQVALSTIVLRISEKDLGQPFEYVQTLQSTMAVTALDVRDSYEKAQEAVTEAGGQVIDSKLTRQTDESAQATIQARVDAEKFPPVRDALRALGHVTRDTVDQQKTAKGGSDAAARPDAPVRREQATISLTISTPPIYLRKAQLRIEAADVGTAYESARAAVESAGGSVLGGSITGQAGRTTATLGAKISAEKFAALVETLRATGTVKSDSVRQGVPPTTADGDVPLMRERGHIELTLVSPLPVIDEEHGLGKAVRDTFAGSVAGLFWSIEMLFVGISFAGPWLLIGFLVWLLYRRSRRRRAA